VLVYHLAMSDELSPPKHLSSQELVDAIRKQSDHTKQLLREGKLRRADAERLRDRLNESLQKDKEF